jgi:hypothetical protein
MRDRQNNARKVQFISFRYFIADTQIVGLPNIAQTTDTFSNTFNRPLSKIASLYIRNTGLPMAAKTKNFQ